VFLSSQGAHLWRSNVNRRVGEVECLAVELCEPCLHLQQLTRPGIIKELIHRTGLNADILNDGASRWVTPSSSIGSLSGPR
jgi:hypothetical protein